MDFTDHLPDLPRPLSVEDLFKSFRVENPVVFFAFKIIGSLQNLFARTTRDLGPPLVSCGARGETATVSRAHFQRVTYGTSIPAEITARDPFHSSDLILFYALTI